MAPNPRHARSLLITADAGGSNGPRVRLWKWELQQLANRTGLAITVCHFPGERGRARYVLFAPPRIGERLRLD